MSQGLLGVTGFLVLATLVVFVFVLANSYSISSSSSSSSSISERFVETMQDKFKREVRFVPRGDQWHMHRGKK